MQGQAFERRLIWILVGLSVLAGLSPQVDLYLANLFYHPEAAAGAWPEREFWLWRFFYYAAPVITAVLLLPAIALYVLSWVSEKWSRYRFDSLYVFLGFLLGPGILVNTIFKPYWGRPRPREVLELGGFEPMQAFWQWGEAGGGYSFPCGHSSVGFALILGYFLWKGRKPSWAKVSLLASLVFGSLMGIGRMADGAHFFTDVLWSAVMAYVPAYYLHYQFFVSRSRDALHTSRRQAYLQGGVLFFALMISVLLATPYKQNLVSDLPIASARIRLDKAKIVFRYQAEQQGLRVQWQARGFGFPGSHIREIRSQPQSIEFITRGFFSDFEAVVEIVYGDDLEKLELEISSLSTIKDRDSLPAKIRIVELDSHN